MKSLCIIVFLYTCLALHAEEYRTFVDVQGREIRAIPVGLDGTDVTIRRDDGEQFTFSISRLSEADQAFLQEKFKKASALKDKDGRTIEPGETIVLEFPELQEMAGGQKPMCELRIPENYSADKTFPLFVWYSGGKGSHKVGGANGMVDFKEFIVVAIPYPGGRLPRLAVNDGDIDDFWDYQAPMLERVNELIPNISEEVRIAGGSSSGAHMVGSGICQKWKGFIDYFTAYVLHEGGYAPEKNYRAARKKPVLVIYGEKSKAYPWQKTFNEAIEDSRADLTFIALPNDGHGLSGEGRKHIREWIEMVAIPKLQ